MPLTLAVLAVIGAGCRHDGRTLRPALPSQVGSVSTSAAPTLPDTEDDFFDTAATDGAETGFTVLASTSTIASSGTGPSTVLSLAPSLTLTAPWRNGGAIDPRYTCDGADVSPALSWTDAPEGTQEIAIVMIDQDFAFDHWVMSGIAPDVTSVLENTTPDGAVEARNGSGATGYTGPCPGTGTTHTYRFTVHYLDKALKLTAGGPAAAMRTAINAATIASASISGTFTGS